MPADPDQTPDHKMGDLLKDYARKRRGEEPGPITLHPVTRRLFQDEVARLRAGRASGLRSWLNALSFSPRLVGAAAVVLVFGVGFLSLVNQQTAPTATEFARQAEPAGPVHDSPANESDHLTANTAGTKVANGREDLPPVLKDAQSVSQLSAGSTTASSSLSPTPTKADRNQPAKRALAELEIVAAQKSAGTSGETATPRPADVEIMGFEKKMANGPTEARRADRDAKAAVLKPEQLTASLPASPPTLAKAKEETFNFGAALSRSAATPPNLQSDSSRSLAYFSEVTALDTLNALTNALSLSASSSDSYSWKGAFIGDGTVSSTNSAFGLSLLDGSPLAAFSALPPAEPAAPLRYSRVSGIGGASESPGSGSARALGASIQASAPDGRQSQRFQQVVLAPAPNPARPGSEPRAEVLATFEFQQEGEKVRVIDADGSVYEGKLGAAALEDAEDALHPTASPAAASATSRARLARREQAERPLGGVAPNQSQVTATRFRLIGTNRTLQQAVLFEGSIMNQAHDLGGEQKLNEKIADERGGLPAQTRTPQPAQQIRGSVRVGGSNAVPIEALAVGK